jgi:phosphomethylpyrimidine synthase
LRSNGGLRCANPPYALNDQQVGMAEMSEKFKAMGEQVYVAVDAVKESNKAF